MDGVLCDRPKDAKGLSKYKLSWPYPEMIKVINECYDAGHKVIIYTARGMNLYQGDVAKTYDYIYDTTKKQLDEWGVKHHQLVMGKLHYDVLIDDKVVRSDIIKSYEDVINYV